jgi:hypothetical protein
MASSAMAANLNRLRTSLTFPEVVKNPENENDIEDEDIECEEDKESFNNNLVGIQDKKLNQPKSQIHLDSASLPPH